MAARTHTVSFSEIDTYRQCAHKWELSYRQRWEPPTVGPALVRGKLWHSVMEAYYRGQMAAERDDANATTQAKAEIRTLLWNETGDQSEDQELVEWMFAGYLERYPTEPFRVLAVEHAAEVWLPTDRGGRSNFKLKVRIDLIVRWDNKIWVCDHKSGRDLPTEKMLDIDDQFGLYTWAMRQLGKPVFGSLHNAARTQRNVSKPQPLEERFSRTRLYRTDEELNCIAVEAYRTIRNAYQWKEGTAPRSPNTDTCRWRCSFTDACLFGRKGQDEQDFLKSAGHRQVWERH